MSRQKLGSNVNVEQFISLGLVVVWLAVSFLVYSGRLCRICCPTWKRVHSLSYEDPVEVEVLPLENRVGCFDRYCYDNDEEEQDDAEAEEDKEDANVEQFV